MNREIEGLFDAAVALPPEQRADFLSRNCPDAALRYEVEQLLLHDAGAEGFLNQSLANAAAAMLQSLTLSPGQRLGPYLILSAIGRGGMGVVYRAERDDGKFEQRVAIKVVSGGLNTPAFVERFQKEYRILASLEHPNIARLLDAGTTEDGLPYFVMEYVEGQPIDRFCSESKLSVSERLRLILPICDAVHFAHQKLIVHRDLKPDNILVTEQGNPKLLDFGIAKVLSEIPGSGEATVMAMTPDYASPEQVRGEPVGTATDVYSLGCVLYKLLTGVAPHPLQGKSPAEAVRLICEEEPRQSSTLNSELGKDEENILKMAMRKEAQRRYRSMEQFAADIGRYLNNEPVLARPATAGYRLQKYVYRHRLGVAVAAGSVLLLAGFAATQAVQARRITRERDRGDRVTQFMTGMFKVSDPSESRGNSITAREILDKASKEIDPGLSKDPELQAQMMAVMGQVYVNLGLYGRAQALLTQAVDVQRRVLGASHPQTLSSMNDLGAILNREGHYTEAEKLLRETLDARRRVLGPEHPDTLRSMDKLSNVLDAEGRHAQAEKLLRTTLDIQRRALGPEHQDTIQAMADLATTLLQQGHYAEAEKLLRTTLDIRRRVLGPEHPDTLVTMSNLAASIKRQGRYSESEKLNRQTLDTRRRVLGLEHPDTLGSMNNLANNLLDEGHYAEADKLQRETLDIQRRVLGPEHPATLRSMDNLADCLVGEGRYTEADKLQRETLDIQRRVLGPEHRDTANSVYDRAILEARVGKRAEAFRLLREAVDHGLAPGTSLGMEKDPDLKSLHGDPRFDALVMHAKERAAAAQKSK